MTSLLIIDDEPALAEVVGLALQVRDFDVSFASTGRDGIAKTGSENPDVVLLDLGLPDIDGIEVCRLLRRWFTNPIIILSGDGAEDRKVEALDAGADDYVTKPFSMPELLARVRVALRHRMVTGALLDTIEIVVGDVTIDLAGHVLRVGTDEVTLTRKEFAIFVLLAQNEGRVLTHETLLGRVWDEGTAGTTESLRVHVTHLRKKLGTGINRPQLLTDPGVGYRLVAPEPRTGDSSFS